MTSPLKSILITSWSHEQLTGHDLDGGCIASFNLDPSHLPDENLGHDLAHWEEGDIATLKLDADSPYAQLRIVTPRSSILRLSEFQIVDIAIADSEHDAGASGRHIFLKGSTGKGTPYVMPMLGYTAWRAAWDFTELQQALNEARHTVDDARADTRLSCDYTMRTLRKGDADFQTHIDNYNEIFYPRSKDACGGTLIDHATEFTVSSFTMTQTGKPRAYLYMAAFVKKEKPEDRGRTELPFKRGTAFSPPYFVVDGRKVFLRTGAASTAT